MSHKTAASLPVAWSVDKSNGGFAAPEIFEPGDPAGFSELDKQLRVGFLAGLKKVLRNPEAARCRLLQQRTINNPADMRQFQDYKRYFLSESPSWETVNSVIHDADFHFDPLDLLLAWNMRDADQQLVLFVSDTGFLCPERTYKPAERSSSSRRSRSNTNEVLPLYYDTESGLYYPIQERVSGRTTFPLDELPKIVLEHVQHCTLSVPRRPGCRLEFFSVSAGPDHKKSRHKLLFSLLPSCMQDWFALGHDLFLGTWNSRLVFATYIVFDEVEFQGRTLPPKTCVVFPMFLSEPYFFPDVVQSLECRASRKNQERMLTFSHEHDIAMWADLNYTPWTGSVSNTEIDPNTTFSTPFVIMKKEKPRCAQHVSVKIESDTRSESTKARAREEPQEREIHGVEEPYEPYEPYEEEEEEFTHFTEPQEEPLSETQTYVPPPSPPPSPLRPHLPKRQGQEQEQEQEEEEEQEQDVDIPWQTRKLVKTPHVEEPKRGKKKVTFSASLVEGPSHRKSPEVKSKLKSEKLSVTILTKPLKKQIQKLEKLAHTKAYEIVTEGKFSDVKLVQPRRIAILGAEDKPEALAFVQLAPSEETPGTALLTFVALQDRKRVDAFLLAVTEALKSKQYSTFKHGKNRHKVETVVVCVNQTKWQDEFSSNWEAAEESFVDIEGVDCIQLV